jgi:hypothetical protein
MATKAKANTLNVDLTPAAEAAEGVSLLKRAQGLAIVDKVTHEAARSFLKGAKALKRAIEEHYSTIKKPLNDARNTVLDMERAHLAPVLEAIRLAERADVEYVREQQRIEAEERERRRLEAEAEERERRAEEAAKIEAEASALESASEELSARERVFVREVMAWGAATPAAWLKAARLAGYKDPQQAADRLVKSQKIQHAITSAQEAAALRKAAERVQSAPVNVAPVEVESQIGTVSGTSLRTYYSCGAVDLQALILAVAENIKSGDGSMVLALEANMPYLNSQARDLKAMFERVYPMCKLAKREGVAG